MLQQMFNTVDDGEGGSYGLGIGYDEDAEYGIIINHDGASSGFQSVMTYLPEEDLVVVILTNNFDSEIMEDLSYEILDYMLEED
jgi:D-alanyl-D-alanine carboxypeptidase